MSNRLSFNRAIAGNTIRRCWPLWAIYLGFLLVTFPLPVLSGIQRMQNDGTDFLLSCRRSILDAGVFQAHAAIVVAILAVMILFGYLYSSRGNTLMNSLPIRRESLFLTMALTGLIPMLLAQVLVMGITALLSLSYGIGMSCFLQWLACAALSLVAFYGFALFCAMLTGNMIILPAVYFVLNLTAIGFETCIRRCLAAIVYGMAYGEMRFSFLSPIVRISETLNVTGDLREVRLEGLGVLAAYAAAGLVFAIFAVLLYRKRRMESVSDFVAIPVLKPIFRICMGFGGAFLFAAILFENFFENAVYGIPAAWLMAAMLLIGAFLGWLAAEMMIRRTVRVFPMPWKGLCAVCLICALTVLIAEMDLTGYERRVPDPAKVARVDFSYDTAFTEAENIRAVTELHRLLIDGKPLYDRAETQASRFGSTEEYRISDPEPDETEMDFWIPIVYVMNNGSVQQRMYTIRFKGSDVDEPDSVIGRVIALLNSGEGIQSRMTTDIPMEEQYVNYAVINRETAAGMENSYRLTPQETVELWNLAMLPDASEGNLSLYTIVDTPENMKTQTSLRIDINLFDESRTQSPYYWGHSYRVFTFSEHCLDWIGEHTNLEWETMDQVTAEWQNDDEELAQ